MTLTPPVPIEATHEISNFNSGQPSLDGWLKKRALKNEKMDASRTYVVCDETRVVAYYCLAAGSIQHSDAPSAVKRNMPDPVPVMILGRLAVDVSLQGHGIGRALVRDAILRTMNAAEIAGFRAILVHALNENAVAFYKGLGFLTSPIDPLVLMIPLSTARVMLTMEKGQI